MASTYNHHSARPMANLSLFSWMGWFLIIVMIVMAAALAVWALAYFGAPFPL